LILPSRFDRYFVSETLPQKTSYYLPTKPASQGMLAIQRMVLFIRFIYTPLKIIPSNALYPTV
jgi:hypothetical protein